jgi:hypothetical protein
MTRARMRRLISGVFGLMYGTFEIRVIPDVAQSLADGHVEVQVIE